MPGIEASDTDGHLAGKEDAAKETVLRKGAFSPVRLRATPFESSQMYVSRHVLCDRFEGCGGYFNLWLGIITISRDAAKFIHYFRFQSHQSKSQDRSSPVLTNIYYS